MNILAIPKTLFKVLLTSYCLWILVSTTLPQCLLKPRIIAKDELYPDVFDLNTEVILSAGLTNKSIYFILAHPDDEVMFFGPTLSQLSDPKYANTVKLISFSDGDYENLGQVRSHELQRSCQIFGIECQTLGFEDNINKEWDAQEISDQLSEILKQNDEPSNIVLVTFDESGVSGHPNHASLYHGVLRFIEQENGYKVDKMLILKSWDFYKKYSFNLFTTFEITQLIYRAFVKPQLYAILGFQQSHMEDATTSIKIFSNWNQLSVSLASMCSGHFSQMVYFRYGWLLLSKYLNSNELIEVMITTN